MPKFGRRLVLGVVAASMVALAGCATNNPGTGANGGMSGSPAASSEPLEVVATTGYLGDAVKNIAPDAKVTVLVGPGGDPHTQALSTQDAEKIESADLVVWTSHDMEHKMMGQLEKMGDKQLPAAESIPEGDLLPWEEDGKVEGHDPHVWNSPDNWVYVVKAIEKKMSSLDAAHASTYAANSQKYVTQIEDMKKDAQKKFDAIPAANRVLITGHDAFNYLGKTFGLEIHATDFVSSEAQKSAKEIDELAATIVSKKVPTIFQDNLANPDAIKHLKEAVESKGWKVEVSDKALYADSLGESAPQDTYLGAFGYNVDTIVEALKGS